MRRFSKVKLPADQDLKLYIQMASIMGFTWITGLVLPAFPSNEILTQIFTYLFILANGSIGPFIFFAFIFRFEVKLLYKKLFSRIFSQRSFRKSKILMKMQVNSRVRPVRSPTVPSVSITVCDASVKNADNKEISGPRSNINMTKKPARSFKERIEISDNDEVFF